jgi:hypothetical protein
MSSNLNTKVIKGFVLNLESRQLIWGIGVVCLVSAIGISLGLQGWNSRGLNFDHINFIEGAHDLLSRGTLPDRGDVSSYGAFSTPGTAWLMLPGMLVFADPRLFELVGSASLYFGTLLGLFLLARMCFGVWCASLSVLLYGLSKIALFYAGSLWSIGHPFFYVWMLYLCIQWIRQENSSYLAAAVIMLSLGMYVDLVIAPALFILPVFWLFVRAPVRMRPLLLATVIVVATWYPYIEFQVSRDFADLRSMVFRESISPANYTASWCMPNLALKRWNDQGASNSERHLTSHVGGDTTSPTTEVGQHRKLLQAAGSRLALLTQGLRSNFEQMTFSSAVGVPLTILVLISLAIVSLLPFAAAADFMHRQRFWRYWITVSALVACVSELFLNEFFIKRFLSIDGVLESSTVSTIRRLQVILAVTAVALLILKTRLASFLSLLLAAQKADRHTPARSDPVVLFALSLLIPWSVMLLVAEPGRPDRYWWLWPLQVVVLAAAVTYLPAQFKLSRPIAATGQVFLTLLLLLHPWVLSPAQSWMKMGWFGPTAPQVQAVDFLANRLSSEARNTAAIGYQIFVFGFMAKSNIIDPRYKVGAQWDMLFKYRHGILNSDQCAEGVSSKDEYRIVQTRPRQVLPQDFFNERAEEYVDIQLDGSFQLVRQFGRYQIFKRTGSL